MDAPSVSWLHAYPPLVLLASAAMTQPAGRLLNTPVIHSVWLRASPILGALDALGLVIRCLAYCVVLRMSPRRALCLIGTERFPTEDAYDTATPPVHATVAGDGERGTMSRFAAAAKTLGSTGIRLIGFGLAAASLIDLAIIPGGREARWTAAWGWMFVSAYAVLEVATSVYRWDLAKPQYMPADFELADEHGSGEGPKDDDSEGEGEGEGVSEDAAERDDDEESTTFLSSAASAGPATATDTAAHAPGDRDIEAQAEAGQHRAHPPGRTHHFAHRSDPAAHPGLPGLRATLSYVDLALLHVCGWPAHLALLFWCFLDLVQPAVNHHFLAVDATNATAPWEVRTGWGLALFYFSAPIWLLVMVAAGLVVGAMGVGTFCLIVTLYSAALRQIPASTRTCSCGKYDDLITWLPIVIAGTIFYSDVYFAMPYLEYWLLGDRMRWIYDMLTVEALLLALFCLASFVIYVLVKINVAGAIRSHNTAAGRAPLARLTRHGQAYLTNEGCALAAAVLVTVAVSLCWYMLRFAASAHWLQNWRDALQYNVAAAVGNGTLLFNATLDNSTASASSVPQPVVLF